MTSKTVFLAYLTLIVMGSLLIASVSASIDGVMYFDTLTGTQIIKRDGDNPVPQAKCKCAVASAVFGNGNTDTTKVHGAITFNQNPCGQTTLLGQFSSGFDKNKKYSFTVRNSDGNVIVNLSPFINPTILSNGGIIPFAATTRQFSVNCPQAINTNNIQGYDSDSSGGGYQFGQSGYGGGFGSDSSGATAVGGSNITPTVMGLGLFIYNDSDGVILDNRDITPLNYNTR